MINRVSRCRGVARFQHQWSQESIELFYRIYPPLLEQFKQDALKPELWQGEVLCGRRASCDVDVLLTLLSWAGDTQFKDEPFTWVLDAIQDCAERDWFYAHEKRYV